MTPAEREQARRRIAEVIRDHLVRHRKSLSIADAVLAALPELDALAGLREELALTAAELDTAPDQPTAPDLTVNKAFAERNKAFAELDQTRVNLIAARTVAAEAERDRLRLRVAWQSARRGRKDARADARAMRALVTHYWHGGRARLTELEAARAEAEQLRAERDTVLARVKAVHTPITVGSVRVCDGCSSLRRAPCHLVPWPCPTTTALTTDTTGATQ